MRRKWSGEERQRGRIKWVGRERGGWERERCKEREQREKRGKRETRGRERERREKETKESSEEER